MAKNTKLKVLLLLTITLCISAVFIACGSIASVTLHNGGSTTKVTVSGKLSTKVPTNPGYAFKGYFDSAEGGTAYTDALGNGLSDWQKGNPKNLYAQWELKEYTFSLDLAGGSYDGETGFKMTYLTVFDEALPVPTKTGYSFGGWYNMNNQPVTSKNGVVLDEYAQFNVASYPTNEETNTVSLYAKWTEKTISFSFSTNGGSECESISAGVGETVSLPVTAKEGYCFIGWSRSSASDEGILSMIYTAEESDSEFTTLYAVYKEATVAGVTFQSIKGDKEYSVSYVGGAEEVYIPDIYQGKPVTEVTSIAKTVTTLYLPNTATTIKEGAMAGCNKLVTLRLPAKLTRITKNMLNGCSSLKSITIPDTVTSIDAYALFGTAFETIYIPASVKEIGDRSLESVAVKSITVDPANTGYLSIDGVLYEKTGGELKLQQYPRHKTGEEFTPDENCTTIMQYAFHRVGLDESNKVIEGALKKVNITGKIKLVDKEAFSSSSLVVAVINTTTANSLQFGIKAFYGCPNLRMIRFFNAVPAQSFGEGFVSTSGNSAYIYVPTSSKSQYETKLSAFRSYIRTENDIYGNYAAEKFVDGYRILQYLGYETEVEVPAYINGLEVKSIGAGAFKDSTAITKIVIKSESLAIIEANAFAGCTSLTSVTLYAKTPPLIAAGALSADNAELRIYVPAGEAIGAYRNEPAWAPFSEKIFTMDS